MNMTFGQRYRANKVDAVTMTDLNTEPSLADQSGARETDINVIVGRYGITGAATQTTKSPMYGDFTNFPNDLRDMIETSRTMEDLRERLPDQLKGKPLEELLTLTPDQLNDILKPPAPPPAPPGEGAQ